MIPEYRERFNREWTQDSYKHMLRFIEDELGIEVKFRISETPVFIPRKLMKKMIVYARDFRRQLINHPEYLQIAKNAIPKDFHVPNENPHPLFLQCDFAITKENGELEPKLIELQGFPSLYGYQVLCAEACIEVYSWLKSFRYLLGGLGLSKYIRIFRRAIRGMESPKNTILMELEPKYQKTLPDFIYTEKLIGVKPVCLTDIINRDNHLYYQSDDREIPIYRIYNRTIAEELIEKSAKYNFNFRDDLHVQWAGHPNWYFKLSKFSLPFLNHPAVPRTYFLDKLKSYPPDLENYVVKPLFSFAGSGVVVSPSHKQLDDIPGDERNNYILQEKIEYSPVIKTPYGDTKVEIRLMFIWLNRLIPVNTLIRLSRSRMMNVDFNSVERWIGASVGFIPQ